MDHDDGIGRPWGSVLTLNYQVTDTGSGVGTVAASINGSSAVGGSAIVNGLAVNLLTALPLGPSTFAIKTSDKVLNTNSATVTFTIIATPQSIVGDVTQFFSSGAISGADVESGLLRKLNAAMAAEILGNCGPAARHYSAFINEVTTQTGNKITPAAAAILIADAQYLIANCP